MTPIHELINRIRWDEAFVKGDFVLATMTERITNYPGTVSADLSYPERSFFLSGHKSGWLTS
jgi:multisubunit Na+/H+ antiporter MnhE subunit